MSKKVTVTPAKELLDAYGRVQRKRESKCLCPRCGQNTMDSKLVRNALSRRADVYICDQCGTDEAMLDFIGAKDNLDNWSLVVSLRA